MSKSFFKVSGTLTLLGLAAVAVYGVRAKGEQNAGAGADAQMPVLAAADGQMAPPPDGGPDGPPPADQGGPDGPPPQDGPPPRGPGGPHGGPPEKRALQGLKLSDEQKAKVDAIMNDFRQKQEKLRADMLKQLKDVLSADQYDQFQHAFVPPPRPEDHPDGPPPAQQDGPPDAPADAPPAPKADAGKGPAVTFAGGYETDPRDGGRPVVLVAAGLNVAPEIFRKAFSNVVPARGGSEPEPTQVRKNKAALMDALGQYGVDNDLLDTVSNYYRYSSSKGEMWKTVPATAYATVQNGAVTAITITNPGAGYSSVPKVSVPGFPDLKTTVTVWYGTDLKKNGSIQEIKIENK